MKEAQDWLGWISLVVAIVGGVPGFVSALTFFRSAAKLTVRPDGVIVGNARLVPSNGSNTADEPELTLWFGALTISNQGDKVLTPVAFELEVKKGRKWIQLDVQLIPENTPFQSEEQDINVSEPWKRDLARFSGTISYAMPLVGFLLCFTTKFSRDELLNAKEHRLTCTDVFGRRHRAEFDRAGEVEQDSSVLPRHGVTMKARPPKR